MPGKKILIVDDEEGILNLLARKLSVEGYDVIKATQGGQAIGKARSDLPNLILMDIVLPDLDGADVVKSLSHDPQTQNIPIIFLSGIVTQEGDKSEYSVNVGGHHYAAIPKPFKFEELLREVRKMIG